MKSAEEYYHTAPFIVSMRRAHGDNWKCRCDSCKHLREAQSDADQDGFKRGYLAAQSHGGAIGWKKGMEDAAVIADTCITRDDIEEFTGAQFAAETIRAAAAKRSGLESTPPEPAKALT